MRRTLFAALAIAMIAAAPVAFAGETRIAFSEAMTEDLAKTYGEREADTLKRDLQRALDRAMARKGVSLGAMTVEATIVDAKPNKPTLRQLSDKPGLDYFQSISLGGADLKARILDADGKLVREVRYSWYEHDIRLVVGSSTWTDAHRAMRRFATEVVEALAPTPEGQS